MVKGALIHFNCTNPNDCASKRIFFLSYQTSRLDTYNLILLQQVKDIRARYWYMVQNITSHWNTRYLQAIKLDDYGKHGALANNFTETLPVPEVNDVKSMLKDPYIFDMLTFTDQYNELM